VWWNGYTGTIAGRYPKSWVKILLLVLLILAVVGTIALFNQRSRSRQSIPQGQMIEQPVPIERF
jgi:hypothetical protein